MQDVIPGQIFAEIDEHAHGQSRLKDCPFFIFYWRILKKDISGRVIQVERLSFFYILTYASKKRHIQQERIVYILTKTKRFAP